MRLPIYGCLILFVSLLSPFKGQAQETLPEIQLRPCGLDDVHSEDQRFQWPAFQVDPHQPIVARIPQAYSGVQAFLTYFRELYPSFEVWGDVTSIGYENLGSDRIRFFDITNAYGNDPFSYSFVGLIAVATDVYRSVGFLCAVIFYEGGSPLPQDLIQVSRDGRYIYGGDNFLNGLGVIIGSDFDRSNRSDNSSSQLNWNETGEPSSWSQAPALAESSDSSLGCKLNDQATLNLVDVGFILLAVALLLLSIRRQLT